MRDKRRTAAEQMPVGARIVLGPERESQPPVPIEASAIAVVGTGRKHQAGEGPLALFLPVLRQHKFVVLDAAELLEGALESVQRTEEPRPHAHCRRTFRKAIA